MSEEARELDIKISSVPRMFNVSDPYLPCARDVIAYVRGEIEPNPWVPIILNTKEEPFAVDELEDCRIYWKGVNDDKAYYLQSLGVETYLVVSSTELSLDGGDDCGLEEVCADYQSKYRLRSFNIIIVGEDAGESREVIFKLRQYAVENERIDIIFPRFVLMQIKLLPNGLDISSYAKFISEKRHRNELNSAVLDSILRELDCKVEPSITAVQDLEEHRTPDIALLTTYLTLKYDLPPVYVPSFLSEYLTYQFIYPLTKLSLYERINFLYRLPAVVGYIGINYGFNCLAKIEEKIFPQPHFVFNLNTMTVEEDPSKFSLNTPGIRFLDFRHTFRESKTPFVSDVKGGISVAGGSDEESDRALVRLFSELTRLVPEEDIFLSVKNSIYVMIDDVRYLLYCPEECGLRVIFLSEYFGQLEHIIPEQEFYRLIDAQIEMALLQKSRAPSIKEGNQALTVRWQQLDPKLALKPAIPIEVSLYMRMLPYHRNGLSYYDKHLRCCDDILPIITSLDSELHEVNPIFEDISLDALRNDPQAQKVLNCFGTMSHSNKTVHELPVTYQAFKDRRLL